MNPLDQIKNIIMENEEKGYEKQESGEGNESGNGKSMQMKNVQQTRSQSEPGSMPTAPGQNGQGEVVLKGPGVDMIQALLAKIPSAVPPDRDPKAKSSSQRMSFGTMDTNLDNNKSQSQDSSEAETTEKEEYEPDENSKMIKEKKPVKAMEEHLGALFNGETLSEDFKQKAALIFQTAIDEREAALREDLANEYEALAEEYVELMREEINEQVDSYLGYVVNEWVEENRLQLENGVRLEIAESFIEGLRTLFVEHGVDVPDGDVNLVDQLGEQLGEMESRLNEQLNRNIELNETLETYRRNEVVATLGEDLTAAEFDRFVKLCENVSYDNDESFVNNINTIKESYFGDSQPSTAAPVNYLTEEVDESVSQPTEINESMDQYVQTLARFGKK